MKVGSLVYATDQGLGRLAKSFVDAGVVTHPFVIRHAHWHTHDDWFPGAPQVDIRRMGGPPDSDIVIRHCAAMDVMLFFETPFDWRLIDLCRSRGVKTIIMPMHECMPEQTIAQPDLWLAPSTLDLKWCHAHAQPGAKIVHLPVPVDGVRWRMRSRCEVYVHNAGHGGLKGRNGTSELIDAWRMMADPPRLILRSQKPLGWDVRGINVDLRVGNHPWESLWDEGDAFVFPEKFNGLSLPLQEACAAGMLVMASNRQPNNEWLPTAPLIPVLTTQKSRVAGRMSEYDEAVITPQAIVSTVAAWRGRDITQYSLAGARWRADNSWESLRSKYIQLLQELCS